MGTGNRILYIKSVFENTVGLLFIGVLFMSGCSNQKSSMKNEGDKIPVYIDPSYFFRIDNPGVIKYFPFETGDHVELESTFIYHGESDWVKTEILPRAKWTASLYPHGRVTDASYEKIIVILTDRNGEKEPFEFEWPIDHETRLTLVSDKDLPPGSFVIPEIGYTTTVCFSLEVEISKGIVGNNQKSIILKPFGDIVDDLVLTEVCKCNR